MSDTTGWRKVKRFDGGYDLIKDATGRTEAVFVSEGVLDLILAALEGQSQHTTASLIQTRTAYNQRLEAQIEAHQVEYNALRGRYDASQQAASKAMALLAGEIADLRDSERTLKTELAAALNSQEQHEVGPWRVIENPDDGTSPFRARIVWSEGLDTTLRAMFVEAEPANSYAAFLNSGGAVNLNALEAQVQQLQAKQVAIDSKGHYCDGMSAAWSDAQEAIGQVSILQAENAALREALSQIATAGGGTSRHFQIDWARNTARFALKAASPGESTGADEVCECGHEDEDHSYDEIGRCECKHCRCDSWRPKSA